MLIIQFQFFDGEIKSNFEMATKLFSDPKLNFVFKQTFSKKKIFFFLHAKFMFFCVHNIVLDSFFVFSG